MMTVIGKADRFLTETLPQRALNPLCASLYKATPSMGAAPSHLVSGVLAATKRLGDIGIKNFASFYPVSALALGMRQIHIVLLKRTAQATMIDTIADKIRELAADSIKHAHATDLDTIPGRVHAALTTEGGPAPVTNKELVGMGARKLVNSMAAWTVRTIFFVGIPYYAPSSSTMSFVYTASSISLLAWSLANRAKNDLRATTKSEEGQRTLDADERGEITSIVKRLTGSAPKAFKAALTTLSLDFPQPSFASLPEAPKPAETTKPAAKATKSKAAAPVGDLNPATPEFWKAKYDAAGTLLPTLEEDSEVYLQTNAEKQFAAWQFHQYSGNTGEAGIREGRWRKAVLALATKAKAPSASLGSDGEDDNGVGASAGPLPRKSSTTRARRRRPRHSAAAAASAGSPRRAKTPTAKAPTTSPSASDEESSEADSDALNMSGSSSDSASGSASD